jgi:energy-coupling factor transport system permease protein
VRRTRYRREPWRAPEWTVALAGVAVAGVFVATSSVDASGLIPSLQPLQWPALPLLPAIAIGFGLLPAWLAPPTRAADRVRPRAAATASAT